MYTKYTYVYYRPPGRTARMSGGSSTRETSKKNEGHLRNV